jgi:formylglycine-generating enzyme required for sulfatase activity
MFPKVSIITIILTMFITAIATGDSINIAVQANTPTIIGVPYELTETQISHYIAPEKIKEIRAWNGPWGSEWGIYKNSANDDFNEFEPGRGYYVIANENITIKFEGEPTARLNLTTGKNLVSLSSLNDKSVQDFLQKYRSLGWKISKIMALDGSWGKGWGAVTGSQFDAFQTIEAQRGYFVFVEKTGQIKKFTNTLGMTFVWIEPGTFMMGSPEDEPQRDSDETQHEVALTQGYYMQTTEVTQGQWKAVMGSNPSYFSSCGDDCPVEEVSWNKIQEFITALNAQEKTSQYRLPTEAEWEYAARAGSNKPFAFGDCLSTTDANYNGNYPLSGCPKGDYRGHPIEVGSLKANAWGLYDMNGNVWEWCQDWYGSYPTNSVTDPVGATSGSSRVIRGGGWYSDASYCRSANRYNYSPGSTSYNVGFRLACRLAPQDSDSK